MKTYKKAFTLIEVVVVLAVLGVLTMLATAGQRSNIVVAETTQITSDISTVEKSINAAKLDDESLGQENTEKEFKATVLKNDEIEKLKVYNKSGETTETPKGKLYKIDVKKLGVDTTLTGTFFSDENNKVYYAANKVVGEARTDFNDPASKTGLTLATKDSNTGEELWNKHNIGTNVVLDLKYGDKDEAIKSQIKFNVINKIPSGLPQEVLDIVRNFTVESIRDIDTRKSNYIGKGTADIVFTDGSKVTLTVDYTVGKSMADSDTATSGTVKADYREDESKVIEKIVDKAKTNPSIVKMVDTTGVKVDTSKSGTEEKVKVKVIYEDLSEQEKTIKVLIEKSMADKLKGLNTIQIDVSYKASTSLVTSNFLESLTKEIQRTVGSKSETKDIMSGMTYDKTPIERIDTSKGGVTQRTSVELNFRDKSKKDIQAEFSIKKDLSKECNIESVTISVRYNESNQSVNNKVKTGIKSVLKGEFTPKSITDVKGIDTTKDNSTQTTTVQVTFQDDSKKTITVKVKVSAAMASQSNITAVRLRGEAGRPAPSNSEAFGALRNVPSTVKSKRISTGFYSTLPESSSDYCVVECTFEDGSTTKVRVYVDITQKRLNEKYPQYRTMQSFREPAYTIDSSRYNEDSIVERASRNNYYEKNGMYYYSSLKIPSSDIRSFYVTRINYKSPHYEGTRCSYEQYEYYYQLRITFRDGSEGTYYGEAILDRQAYEPPRRDYDDDYGGGGGGGTCCYRGGVAVPCNYPPGFQDSWPPDSCFP